MTTPPKRVKIGKPINWTDDDLNRLAAVTPEDIAAAAALWRKAVNPRYAGLLDATEPDAPLPPEQGKDDAAAK